MKKFLKVVFYLIILLLILSFAMKFDFIAKPVADTLGYAIDTVQDTANLVFFVSIGLFLIWAGVGTIAAPIIGGILLILGLAILATTLYKHFSTPTINKP